MPVKEIGGGQVLVDVGQLPNPIEQYQKQLGLIELGQKIAQGPVDQKIKEIDMALKGNELLHIEETNQKKYWDAVKSRNDELRSQQDYFFNGAKSLGQLFLTSPELGALKAKELGFVTTPGKDGDFVLSRQDAKGNVSSFSINPRGITDPEKVATNEANLRQEWTKYAQEIGWNDIDPNYHAIKRDYDKASAGDVGGINDLSMIISFAKIKDPNSVVRSSEGDAIRNTTNLPGWFQLILSQQANPKAPRLTEAQRTMIYNEAQRHWEFLKDNLVQRGKNLAELAPTIGAKPSQIIISQGSLRPQDVLGAAAPTVAGAPGQAPGQTQQTQQPGYVPAPAPVEAGAIRTEANRSNELRFTPDVNGWNALRQNNFYSGLRGSNAR